MSGLIRFLKKGVDVSWLPTSGPGTTSGTKTLCSVGIKREKKSGFSKGTIDYLYLPFRPNGINYCESRDMDVISYPFTGCIMATFTQERVRKVCHVSTGDGQDCKAEWENIKKTASNVMEFKPSDFYVRPHNIALEGIYGLITPDSKCYAITIVRDKDKRFVAGVRECRPILRDNAGVRGPSDVLSAPLGFPGNFP
ncbi:MAG: hypothetical protein U5R30_19550 [Deltaproteobacteria bacterium]|nr:hypothetical protein [Deltaproteobacteria bacterium]